MLDIWLSLGGAILLMDLDNIKNQAFTTSMILKTKGVRAAIKSLRMFAKDQDANMGAVFAVMSVIVISILLYVGIVVLQGVSDSAGLEAGDTFYNASVGVTAGTQGALSMSTVLLIVIVAVAILAALFGIFAVLSPRTGGAQ